MRKATFTGFVTLLFVACAAEKTAPRDRLVFERIERVSEQSVATAEPVRAAQGNAFVIVHLIEDPPRDDYRDWVRSVAEDEAGRKYEARYTSVGKSESETTGMFGRRKKTPHPDRIRIVFEVPETATLRSVNVPDPSSSAGSRGGMLKINLDESR